MVARVYEYKLPQREGLILEYNNGWGEIAPLNSFSKETLKEAREEILSLLPSLAIATPKLPSVRFGVQCAKQYFSLKPLKVPVCAFQSPEIGNSFLKIKVGHLTLKEAIKLARQYYLNYRLRIDCNQKWSLDEALYFTSHFSPNDFDYLEEPVGNLNDLITLSKKTNFPIAVDELALNPLIAQIPTLKAIVAKPMLLGKIPTHPIIPTILSSTYETSLGHLLIARQASEKSLPLGLGTFSLCSDNILSPPLTSAEGFLQWNPSGPPINLSKLCLIAHAP